MNARLPLAALLLVSCTPAPGPPPAMAPSAAPSAAASQAPGAINVEAPSGATLEVGQVQPLLVAAVYEGGRRDLALAFSSSDAAVAAVDPATGRVTGIAPGVASVKVASTVDPTRFAIVNVTVKAKQDAGMPKSASITPDQAEIGVGASVQLRASVAYGDGVADAQVTWSSVLPAIATVDQAGLVTGVKAGTTTIRATSDLDATVVGEARVVVK